MKRFTAILITFAIVFSLFFSVAASADSKEGADFIEIDGQYSQIVQSTGTKADVWMNSESALLATAGLFFAMDIHLDNNDFSFDSTYKDGSMFIGADLEDKKNRILDFLLLGEDENYAFGYYDLKANKLFYIYRKYKEPRYSGLMAGLYMGTYFNQNKSVMLKEEDIEKALQFLASQYAELNK